MKSEVRSEMQFRSKIQSKLYKLGVILLIIITPFFCVESFANKNSNPQRRLYASLRVKENKDFTSLDETQKLYNEIFDLQFNYDAKIEIAKIESTKIKTPLHLVVEDFRDMLFILLTEDKNNYKKLEQNEEIRLKELEKFSDKNKQKNKYYKEYKWAKAEIKLHWAIVKLNFDEKWASAWRIRQAYKLLLENEKEFPDFIEQKKSLALLQIALASVPQKYQWALDLVGMEGDLKGGIKKLDESQAKNHFFQKETFLWKSLLQTYLLEENQKSTQIISTLLKKYPSQKLVLLVSSLVLMKNESHKTALLAWQNYAKNYQNNQLVFDKKEHFSLEYLLAELYFYSEIPKKAKFHYISFLNKIKENNRINFAKDAYYKLFLIDWFDSKDINFNYKKNSFFIFIPSQGITKTAVDKNAKKFVEHINKSNQLPSKEIYKARILTDGGNYQKALETVNQISNLEIEKWETNEDFEAILEYKYRKARILDKLSKLNQAISFYKEVIEYSTLKKQNEIHYFAANSALHLGFVYQEIDKKLAKTYFEKAISLKEHQYEESITQKAKIALKKL